MKKTLPKRIALHRETLRSLTASQLGVVAGGVRTQTCATVCQHSCHITDCWTDTNCC
ncbi:MAG TPA: class I lanthipeptide [Thermoanaerobaculia bacterium]|nr:class I lanthipeptide [Thermoanaerobaculia bacterium]